MKWASSFALLILISTVANATVTQVDGTIVPSTNRMQQALDTYELPAGTLQAVTDAAEVPQIFKPRLASPVVFLDIREGAGFESSFGWYNVGDDVSTVAGRTANLHPVMGCGIPMVVGPGDNTHHSGNPAFYFQNAEEGNTISVDFAMEKTAGRYKGGFIAFYLITPEANPSADNCGDFKRGSDNKSLFGFIYFTQKDLNNDGDFVHHLVYTSKTPDRFYFGFEDLFRGGDNDFEDMAMRIDGLTPPCVPSAEICDGLDNDCDGLIDAADPDLSGVNTACQCDDVTLMCDNGPRFGQCRTGVTACTAGAITCHGTGTATAEVCDGIDNNCNNLIDDNPSGTGAACDGPDADLCKEGVIVCSAGMLVCNDNTGNNIEICNGVDDNCNGMIDEGDPGGGGSCGNTTGACTPGVLHCLGGTLTCVGGSSGGVEVCNNIDDNCNGVVDDNPTDVGMQCGATNVGACEFGQTICVGGSLQCAGQVGPVAETCNNIDDDCNGVIDNNPVDAGQPCGSSIGACRPGAFVCQAGTLVCMGDTKPTAEQCNGIDDDCDGTIDEDVPGENVACGTGACQNGKTKCIAGTMQCVGGATSGTEVCDNIDNDCDGLIDEGPLCNGGVCDNGQCAAPCVPGEFPCPPGKQCDSNNFCVDDPCFNVVCPIATNGDFQVCVAGVCQSGCTQITCPTGTVCRGHDEACVPDTCAYLPEKCAADQICVAEMCVANPCSGVSCPSDQFCRAGACVASCDGVTCPSNQTCRDGSCTATGCARACVGSQVCDPSSGQCVDSKCDGVFCAPLEVCDPLTGSCVADPCVGVTCPTNQTCTMGQCGTIGSDGSHVTVGGGGGCATGGGDGSLVVGLGIVGFALGRRRRRAAALVLAGALAAGGCHVNEYCLDCEKGTGDGGVGDGGSGSGSDGGNVTCDPTTAHPETCNHADDDCDGTIDEGFDLTSDLLNCGACGNICNKAGAQTACENSACVITACFPGFSDVNNDISGPYDQSDGCEYMCFNSNAGVEACDGIDNNCNGVIDEGFATQADVNNCGACNHVCQFFQATPHCSSSTCSFTAADCNAGFHDLNGVQADGCEYQCSPTNGGTEKCDSVDNDCDGTVDETFNTQTDVNNCGRCGQVCAFPHATPHCGSATCSFNPATDCAAGFVDADHNQLNGCEYQCTPTNGGVEICDGKDNDCNGLADDNTMDSGSACAATTPPKGACIANGVTTCSMGVLVCAGATDPVVETCNNIDDDCDGVKDDNVTQGCYTGTPGTSGVGACHNGTQTCAAGVFGACTAQVTPSAELCNGIDDDCNGVIDNGPGGVAIKQTCYTGTAGTMGVGTCKTGTQTCAFGAFGACAGEIKPTTDICGDNLDTDCDGKNDTQEGCLVVDAELRLDGIDGGALGTAVGTQHSFDLVMASGGVPVGKNVYAAWSENVGATTEVYLRKSTDGGTTWGTIVNVTSNQATTSVKPMLAIAPGAVDRVVVAYQTVNGGVRDIIVQTSADGGATFSTPTGALDAAGDSFHHSVAINGTTVIVAWEKLDTATLNRDVMSAVSVNSGTSFATEIKINVGSGATRFAGRPQVALTSANGAIWVWREQRSGSTRDVFGAFSAAPGTAPAADIRIDKDTLDQRESDFPLLAVAGTSAYLVWQDVSTQQNGGSDAMYSRSTDSGATWSLEKIIDDPIAEVSSSFTPVISVDPKTAAISTDDVVAIAWEDRRQGTQIYTSVSTDGGATFATPVRASSEADDPITGKTSVPMIATPGNGVIAVVYENQQLNAATHVFVASSIDSGASWTYTHTQLDAGAGSALSPRITRAVRGATNTPAAIGGWVDFRSSTHINGDIYTAASH